MERINKIEKIAEAVRNLGADAVLLTTDNSRLYAASGFIASRGMVFVTKDGDACYLTDSRYLEAAERELIEKGFTLVDNTLGSTEGLNELIRRHGVKRLAIEDLHMTIGEYEDLRGTLPVELVHAGMAIDKLRAYLTPEDRDALGYAQSLAEKALAETLEVFRIGMTEKELEAELVYRMYLNGADDLSFKPEIISGANASMPHGNPSDKPIAAGDALIMDFGLVKTDSGRICPVPLPWATPRRSCSRYMTRCWLHRKRPSTTTPLASTAGNWTRWHGIISRPAGWRAVISTHWDTASACWALPRWHWPTAPRTPCSNPATPSPLNRAFISPESWGAASRIFSGWAKITRR